MGKNKRVVVPGCLKSMEEGISAAMRQRGLEPVVLDAYTLADIDCGMLYVDNDVCVSTLAAIGQYVRYLREHEAEAVAVVELCRDCRSVSIPDLVDYALDAAGFPDVELVRLPIGDFMHFAHEVPVPQMPDKEPVVGLCGNAAVMTNPLFRDTIAKRLENAGCSIAYLPLGHAVGETNFLALAMEYYHKIGVKSVICILPFGCLGGHAYGRGEARELRIQYPDIDLTLLDYDPSASDINLVNRTELVVQAARERS